MADSFSTMHGVHGAPPIGPQMSHGGYNRLEAERQKIRKSEKRIKLCFQRFRKL